MALKAVKGLRPVRLFMYASLATVFAGIALIGCAASRPTAAPHLPSTSGEAMPSLGQSIGLFANGGGFGEVKPATIFNGGDPTGLVSHVQVVLMGR